MIKMTLGLKVPSKGLDKGKVKSIDMCVQHFTSCVGVNSYMTT